ncbi:MAG: UbiD family decarboxylase [Rhodospirillales bacterium]
MPDTLSEHQFAGRCAAARWSWWTAGRCRLVLAEAEIAARAGLAFDEDEGLHGDHTGYYNASCRAIPGVPVMAITMRRQPIYLSTFTGRPPDEPSVLGEALNDVFVPLLSQQFPEIVDFLAAAGGLLLPGGGGGDEEGVSRPTPNG